MTLFLIFHLISTSDGRACIHWVKLWSYNYEFMIWWRNCNMYTFPLAYERSQRNHNIPSIVYYTWHSNKMPCIRCPLLYIFQIKWWSRRISGEQGCRLNIQMSSYQYGDPHIKDKTAWRPGNKALLLHMPWPLFVTSSSISTKWTIHEAIESIKTTSMEDVCTRVLEKI